MLHDTIIQLQDQTAMGETYAKLTVSFKKPIVTVRDIIAQRIQFEVDSYNQTEAEPFFSLVKPVGAEVTPNGYEAAHHVDAEKQIEVALEAFETEAFLILIGDQQAKALDEQVLISQDLEITFIKLKDLVGG